MINKENLDKRICDYEQGSDNTQTYREHIKELEDKLGMGHEPIDLYGDYDLQEYTDELYELWIGKLLHIDE